MKGSTQQMAFIWSKYKSWRGIVLRLLADLIDENVFAELKRHPPCYFVSDDLTWLDEAIQRAKGIFQPEICGTLLERLPRRYQFIRAFHGCRTDSQQSYLEQGLLPSDPCDLNRIAFEVFSNKQRVEAAIQDLVEKSLGSSYPDHNKGKVFFCLQMEHLVEDCGHYLLYGSEYLLCIANRVGEPGALRRRGRATAIECNVPIKDIPVGYLRCLAGQILREIFEKHCDRTYRTGILNFGFHITTTLEPKSIVGVHYPRPIRNPHNFSRRED